jgi:hypothetical protein
MLDILVELPAGRGCGAAPLLLRAQLLRGSTQAQPRAQRPPAHLTIKEVDRRVLLGAQGDDQAVNRHGLLIAWRTRDLTDRAAPSLASG